MPTKDQALKTLEKLIKQYTDKDSGKHLSESDVIQKYIEVMLKDVLGWDIGNSDRYRRELHTQAGRPDLTYTSENSDLIFIEAKRFGVIDELNNIGYEKKKLKPTKQQTSSRPSFVITPEQLRMPGIAVDRTQEEQQAINYAFQLGGEWAILTNFERLRLFNARRDWLVLSFESPSAYLEDFDLLWELSNERILNGSLDYLSKQRHREDIDPDYLELISEWRETLANDILNNPNKNQWAFDDNGNVNLLAIRGVVQRVIDRLVIIRFAEDHLVIPSGTLYSTYELHKNNPYTFSMDEFVARFFNRFDHHHNSALFAYGLADEAQFSDNVLVDLVSDLYLVKYRAMPADILGNTYEQYLGKALVIEDNVVTSRDNLETRKKQGSYYTPQVIVSYLVDNSLGRYLYGTENGKPDGKPVEGESRKTSADIRNLHVLDSACGSGSFLINAYYVLANFYEGEIKRIEQEILEVIHKLSVQGKSRFDIEIEVSEMRGQLERIRNYPNLILETHIYGTDLDPQAAEIAVVNLMMRAMEKQGADKHRLPLILNQNVKVGNALIGLRYDDPRLLEHSDNLARIRALRLELVGTDNTDPRHDEIVGEIEWESKTLYDHFHEEFAHFFADLERVRPFHWGIEFPEVFYDETGKLKENSGFDVIIGNPPWEIIEPDLREFYSQFDPDIESRLSRKKVENRIDELNEENPKRALQFALQVEYVKSNADYFKNSSDYQFQGRGKSATHKLFLERMYTMLNNGRLGYVIPSGIYSDYGTQELRKMLFDYGSIEYLYSFSNERFFFNGVDHRFKFCLLGTRKGDKSEGFWASFRFNPRVAIAPTEFDEFVNTQENLLFVQNKSIQKFSPDTLSLMEFENKIDYVISEKIYNNVPLIGSELINTWSIRLNQEFNMTSHRDIFNTAGNGIPLVEGKMIHQFDANYSEASYWINFDEMSLLNVDLQQQIETYRVAHRRIASSTNERTLISAIIPPMRACEVNATLLLIDNSDVEAVKLYVCSILNSLCLDFIIRYKVVNTLNMFYIYQLPLPRLQQKNFYFDALVERSVELTCITQDFADLWQEVMEESWDESKGATDEDERQQLRNEIDALVAHLYGLSRDEFEHILSTFPLVFPDDKVGQAKKEHLLEVYDEYAVITKDWSRT